VQAGGLGLGGRVALADHGGHAARLAVTHQPDVTRSPMRATDGVAQGRGVFHRLAVDGGDHVAGLDAGLLGGDPSTTCDTSAPWVFGEAHALGDVGREGLDVHAEHAAAHLACFTSWFITVFIMLDGMAKPMPMLPPCRDRIRGVDADQLAV